MSISWLDLGLSLVILVSLIAAIARGLTTELIRLAAAVIGFLAALWGYGLPASYLEPYTSTPGVAGFLGFLLILGAFLALGWLVSGLALRFLKAAGLRWFDRLLGAAFGLVRGLLLAAAVVLAILAFAPGTEPVEAVARSRVAPLVLYGARVIVLAAPRKLRDGFNQGFEQLRKAWRESQVDTV